MALGEVLRRVFKEDPKKKELAELVSGFRGQIENLLGESLVGDFEVDSNQAKILTEDRMQAPAALRIRKGENGYFRCEVTTEILGNALELKGNKPSFFEKDFLDKKWEQIRMTLSDKINALNRWITLVEDLAASPAPVAL